MLLMQLNTEANNFLFFSGNCLYGKPDTGYMDSSLFISWFKDVLIAKCGQQRPVLFVMDNHATHISLNVVKLAVENDVTLLGLPPHTTPTPTPQAWARLRPPRRPSQKPHCPPVSQGRTPKISRRFHTAASSPPAAAPTAGRTQTLVPTGPR